MRRNRHSKKHLAARRSLRHESVQLKLFYSLIIVFLLIAGFMILSVLLSPAPQPASPEEIVALATEETGFIRGNEIDSIALQNFDASYESIRVQRGIEDEFYVYFEDPDGNVIPLDGKKCFGADKAEQMDPKCR